MKEHEPYMRRCLELARKALGYTYPNPMVGAVIVHEGKIIGEGYHRKAGGPHAEINAINSVKDSAQLSQSTIYVSLEPCSHYGKTPPCSLKLREIGFKKVVIGTLDPHEKVNGQGKKMLEGAGIEVISGVLEADCRELNKRFFTFHGKKRPYIILKWAQSADGFLDRNLRPHQIGNTLTKQAVHQLRAEEHAILVGTTTALRDLPSLTVREVKGQNPVRLLIDLDLKVTSDNPVFSPEAPTIVFNTIKSGDRGHLKWRKVSRNHILEEMMQHLYSEGVQSVLVEGGSFTLRQFLSKNLWDEAWVIKGNDALENGTPAPEITSFCVSCAAFRNNNIEFYRNRDAV